MPETVGGVPIHPLVVHAVVVLIPLTAFGVAVLSVVPRWRPRYGVLVAITGVVGGVLAPIAKLSGENLKETVGDTDLVRRHADLGTNVLYGAVPLAVMAVVLWWLGRRAEQGRPVPRGVSLVAGAMGVVVAIAATVQIILIGHTGAEAVWS
jgi:uncharacterized membrane protein